MATQILPYEPSPSEKRKQWIAENVFGYMDDRYRANRLSQGIVDTIDMIPGYGDIEGIREGYHLATEGGSPYIGTGIAALGALPFVPGSVTRKGTDFLREQAAKLRVTPTQYTIEDTSPRGAAYNYEAREDAYEQGFPEEYWDQVDITGQPFTIETMAERSILNNKQFQNPYKKYNVRGLIQSTLDSVPGAARANLERQFNEWIPEQMKEGKATLQEVLDEIGRNKPKIHQQVDSRPSMQVASEEVDDGLRTDIWGQDQNALDTSRGTTYMPMIPTDENPRSISEAARTLPLLRYTEKNVSVSPEKFEFVLPDGGHPEVGAGVRSLDIRNTPRDSNAVNRVFHTRSGVYQVKAPLGSGTNPNEPGKRVLIPAEGQSGMYGMLGPERKDEVLQKISAGDNAENLQETLGFTVRGNDIAYRLGTTRPEDTYFDFGMDFSGSGTQRSASGHYSSMDADAGEYLDQVVEPNLKPGYTVDDWKKEVQNYRDYIETQNNQINNMFGFNTKEYNQELGRELTSEEVYQRAVKRMDYDYDKVNRKRSRIMDQLAADLEGGFITDQQYNDGISEAHALFDPIDKQHSRTALALRERNTMKQAAIQAFSPNLQAMVVKQDTGDAKLHMFEDWFPMHMKMSMNDAAVDPRIDAVWFPINDYALQRQTGMDQGTAPARMQQFSHELGDDDARLRLSPGKTSARRGRQYDQKTRQGIKRIEAEYGIKLNAKQITDDNRNKFLEIQMTPEIREAFQKVLMNKGGEVNNRPMMPLQYFDRGGQSKDLLDRGVEAYEEAPIIAQIIAGETPAGFAADVASAAKYGRDAVRSVVAGQYGDALAPSIMSALSIVGLIPGIGALGTLGKKSVGQYLGKVRGRGDYGVQDTGHHAYRGFKLDPNIQGETAQYQDLARRIKEAEAQVPGGIENPQRSITIPDPRSQGAQLSQSQGVSGGGRYIQGGPHPDDVYIQGADGSVMLVNETTGTSRKIAIDGIPEGAPIRQPGGRMQIKDSTMPGGSRPLGGYAHGGAVNRPLMNLRY